MKIRSKLLLGVGIVGVASLLFVAGVFAGSQGVSVIPTASAENVSESQMQSMADMCENLKKSDPAAYKQMLDLMKSPEVKKVLDGSEIGRKMYQAMEDENFAEMEQIMKDPDTLKEMSKLMKEPAIKKAMRSMHKNGSMQKMHENMLNNPNMKKMHENMHSGTDGSPDMMV